MNKPKNHIVVLALLASLCAQACTPAVSYTHLGKR